jgi:phosphatidylserine/phosphatidylglycerophosphate/cardiolipin synthase-like enzyme
MQAKAHTVFFVILLVATVLFITQKLGPLGSFPPGSRAPAGQAGDISVYFSPHGGCEAAVVAQIESAQQTIDVQAYSFTSHPIANALSQAEARGVKVRVIIDRTASNESGSEAAFINDNSIPTYTDGAHPIAHNKVMIIDGQTVITGSFNFTKQAENANAENLLVLSHQPTLAVAYESNFQEHLSHSEPFSDASMETRTGRRSGR